MCSVMRLLDVAYDIAIADGCDSTASDIIDAQMRHIDNCAACSQWSAECVEAVYQHMMRAIAGQCHAN